MKRTEMILKIMEMLIELPEDVEGAATSLLTRIERAGMQPPPSKNSFKVPAPWQAKFGESAEITKYHWDPE